MDIQAQIQFLKQFVTEHRWQLFEQVIDQRTRYITVALEDIYQPHNASAVLRTCDALGIQDIHIIENRNKYRINPEVSVGAHKWLSIHKYNQEENNTLAAINHLRSQGYRIVATTPHRNDVELKEFDLNAGKIALFFGSELPGLTEIVLDNADEFVKIDMYGFTESFNISVSAAIILHYLTAKLRQSQLPWHLSENEKEQILLQWLKKSIRNSQALLKRLENEAQEQNN